MVASPNPRLALPIDDLKHRIPVIDKMMRILALIEESPDGTSISTITEQSRVPRSTAYRILNTLVSHGVLVRVSNGDYRLGFRLVSLAARVDVALLSETLVDLVHPALAELADRTGETCKLSVLKEGAVEVVDVVLSPNPMAPSSRVGSRFPLHAGAASKTLLAYADEGVREEILKRPREAYTERTVRSPADLRRELTTIRAEGVGYDRGEWHSSVHAVAAPLLSYDGSAIGAISVTYFANGDPEAAADRIRPALLAVTRSISRAIGYRGEATAADSQSTGKVRLRRGASSKATEAA